MAFYHRLAAVVAPSGPRRPVVEAGRGQASAPQFRERGLVGLVGQPSSPPAPLRTGAVRRRQEIPDEDMIVGRLPKGKLISLSHCWDATDNCDPTGEKMRDLAQALEDLDATGEEDGT